jgi:coenzyme F420-0:L-glutamate ligase / coenzyme F420-1:gamma-L-glutamate ligase
VVSLLPIEGLPLIEEGARLPEMIVAALAAANDACLPGDILVVAHKVVSKSEGRTVCLADVIPSDRALQLAQETEKNPAVVQLILQESRVVLRTRPGLIVVEDNRGLVCANAGIDRSNVQQVGAAESVALLPLDPDRSARDLRDGMFRLTGVRIGVIINDSHGRAWREGTVGVAIGLAGIPPVWDRRGEVDRTGYVLQHTVIGLADEIAAAASVVMGAAGEGIPAVIVRGLDAPEGDGSASDIQRPESMDLFR